MTVLRCAGGVLLRVGAGVVVFAVVVTAATYAVKGGSLIFRVIP